MRTIKTHSLKLTSNGSACYADELRISNADFSKLISFAYEITARESFERNGVACYSCIALFEFVNPISLLNE